MDSESYRASVIGATGAVGSALVRELVAFPCCDGVVALSRRQTDALGASPKLAVHVVDLEQLEAATRELAAGCDAAFCTLGLGQPSRASFEEFWRVDVEYAKEFEDDPELAKLEKGFRGVCVGMEGPEAMMRFSRYPNVTVHPIAVYRSFPIGTWSRD